MPWPLDRLGEAIAECHDAKSLIALLWLAGELARGRCSHTVPHGCNAVAALGLGQAQEPPRVDRRIDAAMAIAEVPAAQRRLTELTLEFLGTLELERGLSRNTLEAYRSDLQQFGAFLARHGGQPGEGLDPLAVTPADLADFVSELAGGGDRPALAPATLQRKIACLRSFYRHLRREQIIDHDPTAELRPPRSRGRLPKVLSRDEVNRLLAQPSGDSVAALRDRALLETMYACGLRASEAIGLELAALDLEDGTLRAFGKGSKERLVPVGSSAVAALSAYLERRPAAADRPARRVARVPQHARAAAVAPGPLQDRPGPRRHAPGSPTR